MDVKFGRCGECNAPFLMVYDTDYVCDECADKLSPGGPHHFSKKELDGRNWDDRKIKKQWQETSKDSMRRILDKCKGTNYGCK